MDDRQALVIGIYPTTDGVSFGPLISGENIHHTMYSKRGFFDVHLTVKEADSIRHIPILRQPELSFWARALEDLRGIGFNKPYDPRKAAYLLTKKGIELFETVLQKSASVAVVKSTATVDLDFVPMLSLLNSFDMSLILKLRPAQELLDYPEIYRVGVTPQMEALRVKENSVVSYPTDRNILIPVVENLFGFRQLIQYLQSRGLANSFIKPRNH